VSMQERAKEVGGYLQVHSAPGQGTTVEVMWP
jgi:signal transduction histidine kinase